MISKDTLDRVRFAKQYIENKYSTIIMEQQKTSTQWDKLFSLLPKSQVREKQQQITAEIVHKQTINNRLLRQHDSLANYKLFNVIGRGAFGEVRLARNIQSGQVVAIKRLAKKYILEKKHIYNAYLEREVMSKVNSQFMVKMKSAFQDEQYLYIAMEFLQGGDLLHLLIQKQILTESQTKFYIGELVLALEQMHKLNYIHRDVKPDNILIDKNGHIKLTDFGLSKHLQYECQQNRHKQKQTRLSKLKKLKKLTHLKNKQKMFSKVGTPDYISPQVLTDKNYTHSIDFWGAGVVMFQCLFGYPPFVDDDPKEVCHRVVNWGQYLEFPKDSTASTAAKMLILGLINQKSKRLGLQEIKNHPFFEGFNWKNPIKNKPPLVPKIKNDIDNSYFDYFQMKNPWTEAELNFFQALNKKKGQTESNFFVQNNQNCREKQERATVGPKFKFPGFQYKRLNIDPLESTIKQFEKKLMHKSFSKQKPRYSKDKKSTQKTRPSQELSCLKSTNLLSNFPYSSKDLRSCRHPQLQMHEKQNIKPQKKQGIYKCSPHYSNKNTNKLKMKTQASEIIKARKGQKSKQFCFHA